jgi:hypothetical protein
MTPAKCTRHELRPGELADGPRYTAALREVLTCPDCRELAGRAEERWATVQWLRRMAHELQSATELAPGRDRVVHLGVAIRSLAQRIEDGEHLSPAN